MNDSTIVTTSDAGGISHLELLSLGSGESRRLTRTSGSHILPESSPAGDQVYFLALHSRGYDLRRVATDSLPPPAPPLVADLALFPALPPPPTTPPDSFGRTAVPADRPYGLGPRHHRVLPGVVAGAEGMLGMLVVNGIDPVGRFSWLLRGAAGSGSDWLGASADAELRTWRPSVRASVFSARHEPTAGREGAITLATSGHALDARYTGGLLSTAISRDYGTLGYSGRAGFSLGTIEQVGGSDAPTRDPVATSGRRALALAELTVGARWDGDQRYIVPRLSIRGATGRTADSTWTRGTAKLTVDAAVLGLGGRATVQYAAVSDRAPAYERLIIGGLPSPLIDGALLDQRWAMPALPVAVAAGNRAVSYRVESSAFGLRPYFWGGAAGDGTWQWHRAAGLEYVFNVAPLSFVGLPAVQVVGGAARSLDAPFERTRAYLTVSYSP